MNKKQMSITFLMVGVLLAASVACSFFSDLRKVSDTADTAEAFITDADIDMGTVEAMGPTLEAMAPTLKAKITESGISETLQAAATNIPIPTQGEKPADIPLMDGSRSLEITSSKLVSYIIDAAFDDVVAFYDREMPVNGWTKNTAESEKTDNYVTLVFEKGGRKATVTITEVPFMNQISVSITIE